jgi:hypothetical protein
MNVREDDVVLININSILIRGRVSNVHSNGIITLYLLDYLINGERTIDVTQSDIVSIISSATIKTDLIPKTIINQILYPSISDNLYQNNSGGRKKKSRNNRNKKNV